MTRAIKLDGGDWKVFDLKPYPHLHDVLGSHFDIVFLNGVTPDPRHISVGIAVDDEGLLKHLPINTLATSLRSLFCLTDQPLVGPAVVMASDWEGENIDVPMWAVALIDTVKWTTDEAHRYLQRSENN